jgi:hypothetical protein
MTMTKTKAARQMIAFASLMLAITILTPASALGSTSSTGKLVKFNIAFTDEFNAEEVFSTGRLTNQYKGTYEAAKGSKSPIGKGTLEGKGTSTFSGFNTLAYSDSWVATATNGDQLFGTSTGTVTFGPEGLNSADAAVSQPITGGTGRFKNASGTLTGTYHAVLTSFAWPLLTYSVQGSTEGRIGH